jgi:hypothetical protein
MARFSQPGYCHTTRKDHLGRNDRKDSHYNLITSDGSADLDLMPIRVFNRIVRNYDNTMTKTPCCKTPLKLVPDYLVFRVALAFA